MIECSEDKVGGLDMGWKGNEKFFWYQMKNKLNLFDPLEGLKKESKGIWYTWWNFQKGSKRMYCRLDGFYANRDLFSFDLVDKEHRTKVHPSSLSNHDPIEPPY